MSLKAGLDHLILGAPDLDRAVAEVASRLGATPAPGGVHPTMSTANALLGLGGRAYLEVLAPAPGHASPGDMARQLAELPRPSLVYWAAQAADLDAVAAAARTAGLRPQGPTPGSRETPDGVLLQWRMLMIGGHDFGQFVPFFIDWGATPHPVTTSPSGPVLRRFSVAHPRAAELERVYRALGLDTPVTEAAEPLMTAEIDGVDGPAVLTGPHLV